jgi:hypothetical protein
LREEERISAEHCEWRRRHYRNFSQHRSSY